jgi:hypothetical protein
MSGIHRPRQGLDHLRRRAHQLGPAVEVLGQAAARHELKGKVRPARGLADVVDLHNVGMLQARDHPGLGAKAGQLLWAGVSPVLDHLQGHGALEGDLAGLVDDAHAAPAQLPEDLEARHGGRFGFDRDRRGVRGRGRITGRSIHLLEAMGC